jgi:hypothetical protein
VSFSKKREEEEEEEERKMSAVVSAGHVDWLGDVLLVGNSSIAWGVFTAPHGEDFKFDGVFDFSAAIVTIPVDPPLVDVTLTGNTVITSGGSGASLAVETLGATWASTADFAVNARLLVNDMMSAIKALVITPSAVNPTPVLTSLPAATAAQIASTAWLKSTDGNRLVVGGVAAIPDASYVRESEVPPVVTATTVMSDVNVIFSVSTPSTVDLRRVVPRVVLFQSQIHQDLIGSSQITATPILLGTVPVGFRPSNAVTKLLWTQGLGSNHLMVLTLTPLGEILLTKPNPTTAWLLGESLSIRPFSLTYEIP